MGQNQNFLRTTVYASLVAIFLTSCTLYILYSVSNHGCNSSCVRVSLAALVTNETGRATPETILATYTLLKRSYMEFSASVDFALQHLRSSQSVVCRRKNNNCEVMFALVVLGGLRVKNFYP